MTDPKTEPREFWIIDEYPYSTWVSSKPLHSADTKEEIHVIEYSAFESMKARAEAAESFNEDCADQMYKSDLRAAKLADRIKKLREAMIEAEGRYHSNEYGHAFSAVHLALKHDDEMAGE